MVIPLPLKLRFRADTAPLEEALDEIAALLRLEDDSLAAAARRTREPLLERFFRLGEQGAADVAVFGAARRAGRAELIVPVLPGPALAELGAAAQAWAMDFGTGHDATSVVSAAPAEIEPSAGASIVPIAFSVVKGGRP